MKLHNFCIIVLFLLPWPLMAGDTLDTHVQAAFQFAKRKDWSDALAHAKATHNPLWVKFFTWEYVRDSSSDASFDDITGFLKANPNWPDKALLEKHAEVALLASNPSPATLEAWFTAHPPISHYAKIKLTSDPEALKALIREAWVQDDYDETMENQLLAKYGSDLRPEDHARRIDRLLWEGKEDAAKRLIKYVPRDKQKDFNARMALADNKFLAPLKFMMVPNKATDPGLLYEHIRWRMRHDDKDGVRELLLILPAQLPYPEKWWPLIDRQVREALSEGNVALAKKMLSHNGQKEGTRGYREAEWLSGWIALEYENNASLAYSVFAHLYKQADSPMGKATAAYWAARAAEKSSKANASQWFEYAAENTTTFYGQLALWELHKDSAHLVLHSSAEPTAEEKQKFNRLELVQMVHLLGQQQETDQAGKFIYHIIDTTSSPTEIVLATRLGHDIHHIEFGVRAAKKALQHNVVAIESGWPVIDVPSGSGIENPLLLGLIRQESEFYTDAVSPSGACGLMQLLPGTAKETAHKAGMSYSYENIFVPQVNMKLGGIYIGKMVTKFNGSYVLAVAGYNAGPGRVQQWVNMYGAPKRSVHTTLDWIELIPAEETRLYVKHVLENAQIYRQLLSGKSSQKLEIANDLLR